MRLATQTTWCLQLSGLSSIDENCGPTECVTQHVYFTLGKRSPTAPRLDPRTAVQRDSSRLSRREQGHRSFWRSLNVIGMVGWPIVLATVGGVWLGRYLDMRLESGIRFTLLLLMVGALLGAFVAWKAITQKHD